jgi:hypothetical protein
MDWLTRIFDWLREQEAGFSAVAAILVIAGVVFAGFRWLVSRRSQPTPEPVTKATSDEDPLLALPTGPVVAVLPFENLSRDPDQEYFSDGLTDDIITALSRFKDCLSSPGTRPSATRVKWSMCASSTRNWVPALCWRAASRRPGIR